MFNKLILLHNILLHYVQTEQYITSPPDDPPGVRRVSNGLLVLPVTLLYVSQHWHSSGVLLTSKGIAPADFSDATAVASLDAILSFGVSRPALLLMPKQKELVF